MSSRRWIILTAQEVRGSGRVGRSGGSRAIASTRSGSNFTNPRTTQDPAARPLPHYHRNVHKKALHRLFSDSSTLQPGNGASLRRRAEGRLAHVTETYSLVRIQRYHHVDTRIAPIAQPTRRQARFGKVFCNVRRHIRPSVAGRTRSSTTRLPCTALCTSQQERRKGRTRCHTPRQIIATSDPQGPDAFWMKTLHYV